QLKGYTAPPPAPFFHYGGNWEIPRIGLNNNQFITLFPANHEFMDPNFEFSAPSARSLMFFRIVAIIVISAPFTCVLPNLDSLSVEIPHIHIVGLP
ncbi:hypothetical protein TSUD_323400, partial [Trifolium subterraneum]